MNYFEFFTLIDEPYAAGLFEYPERSYFFRHCNAYANWFKTSVPAEYSRGEQLYPDSDRLFKNNYNHRALKPHYALCYDCDLNAIKEKCLKAGNPEAYTVVEEFRRISNHVTGWTHGSPNFRRILEEGLDSYEKRIIGRPENTQEEIDFKEGLLRLVEGMKIYWNNCIEYLVSVNAPDTLIKALKKVPFSPAETYYEGLVAWNAVFYFDGCDNLGCLDQGLKHLYKGEDLTEVIAEMFANIDSVGMWSCTIGPECNAVTRQALKAIKGRRRPLLELRVTEDTPYDIWELAVGNLETNNCTNPSFYNEKGIHDMLKTRFPYIPDEELIRFCGGGCTETNLEGITHAGGTDPVINLLKKFEEYLHKNLAVKETFEEFFEGLMQEEEKFINQMLDKTEEVYRYRSKYFALPMRTLFFDDCIDKGKDYYNGGTRYTYSMNSENGLINVIDSLSAIKTLYYDKKKYTAEEFLRLLREENEEFFAALKKCPCFGTDNDEVDRIGAVFAERMFSVYRNKKPTLEFMDAFTLTEHQFSRYEYCGKEVGPTPDGRHNGEPTADSLASLRGKAVNGPTAMLNSSAKLPQNLVDGISVVNLTLQKSICSNPDTIRSIVLGYFCQGGIQLQITATSPEELQDALVHPEKHEDLIVRVGGYSEYFNRLTDGLKKAIVERDVHSL